MQMMQLVALLVVPAPAWVALSPDLVGIQRRAPPTVCSTSDSAPSFLDKLRYGRRGKPAPAPPSSDGDAEGAVSLEAFFAQLDTDQNGVLDRIELKRALVLCGIKDVDSDATFQRLDSDQQGGLTFAQFDTGLDEPTKATILSRLNEKGVLDSLYLPPEQWTEERSKAELKWEQMVQMQAQRSGNALKQNDILRDELGKM